MGERKKRVVRMRRKEDRVEGKKGGREKREGNIKTPGHDTKGLKEMMQKRKRKGKMGVVREGEKAMVEGEEERRGRENG